MGFYEVIDLLTLLSPIVLLLGVVAGIYRFMLLDNVHRTVTGYLGIALATDLLSRFYVFSHETNLVFILIFSLLELGLFSYLYFRLVFKRRKLMLLILVPAGAVFIAWELFHLQFERVREFQSYSKVIDTFLIVSFAIAFLFERLEYRQSMWDYFRLNAIILAFFSFNLLFFLPLNLLINEQSELKFWFWFGNLLATIAFYTLLTREIWINGMNRRQ